MSTNLDMGIDDNDDNDNDNIIVPKHNCSFSLFSDSAGKALRLYILNV
ncbi:hypothetical protein U2F10_09710 [Leptothoe sp. EHU-05/26/07-4]